MNEGEKIDFLMNLTNTKNVTLANALFFDPSYIGRLRNGKRGIPTHRNFIEPAAEFFAGKINSIYQRNILSNIVNHGVLLPDDKDAIQKLLTIWLQDNTELPGEVDTSNFSFSSVTADVDYGNEGRRRLHLSFLHQIAALKQPVNIFMLSDENLVWFYEDMAFLSEWTELLIGLLSNGCHLKIIHTTKRPYHDMITVINKWLPLYKTRAVEPYYYPTLRDGIYRRSLVIAEGISCLMSNSITNDTSGTPQFFFHSKAVAAAMTLEFNRYLSLCKPFVEIYSSENTDDPVFKRRIKYFKESDDELFTLQRRFPGTDMLIDIHVKQTIGAFIRFVDGPPTVYYSNEPNMLSALIDFIREFQNK
ncbi:MAG: hypothetical protein IJ703_11365 [Eubacterium sp.]|nr:hypothetical protein [Eubacterium sp.]